MLLVLDLDGCILDTGSWKHAELATELFARPHLHEMLSLVSPFYDVIIWSQTAWIYLERKIIELEMIGPTARGDYHIVSCLDKESMFQVYSEKEGKTWNHHVKVSKRFRCSDRWRRRANLRDAHVLGSRDHLGHLTAVLSGEDGPPRRPFSQLCHESQERHQVSCLQGQAS